MSTSDRLRSRATITAALGLVLVLAALLAACAPQDHSASAEGDDGEGAGISQPPQFPDTGQVPTELLVEGLVYDFTSVPADLNLWVPSGSEATCAAQKIVGALGPVRLSELGFRPGTSGASLNDIDLSVDERDVVTANFMDCVNMTEAVASLLIGDGRLTSKPALCVAKGLESKGHLRLFVKAWAFGEGVDPFADDAGLAADLLAYSNICLSDDAFVYPGVDLPGDDEVQAENEQNGVSTTVEQPKTTENPLGGFGSSDP